MRRPTASFAPSAPRALALTLALAGALALTACTPPQGSSATPETTDPTESSSASDEASPSDDASSSDPGTDASETSSGPADDVEYVRGLPTGVEDPGQDTTGGVGWTEAGDALLVVTYGSSSCPLVPVSVEAEGTTIEIELLQAGGAVCTMDFVPTTSTVDAPPSFDPAAPVTAVLGDLGQVTVPAAATPPALGWTTAEG